MADDKRVDRATEELLAPLRVAAEATENAAHLLWIMGPTTAGDGTVRRPTGDFATFADDVSAAIEAFDRVIDRLVRRAARAAYLEPDGAAASKRLPERRSPWPRSDSATSLATWRLPGGRAPAAAPHEQPRPDGGSSGDVQG